MSWWLKGVIVAIIHILVITTAQKNGVDDKSPVISTEAVNTTILDTNKTNNTNVNDSINNLSAEEVSSPKIARHLSPKTRMMLKEKFLVGMKRPWFSSKIGDRQMVIVQKVEGKHNGNKIHPFNPPPPPPLIPVFPPGYAPRSLDMGGLAGSLINNFDLYGNQGVLPSGTPNSLDHLYLPEMVNKNFAKPLDLNGIGGHNDMLSASPTGGDFMMSNYEKQSSDNNFRGNPIDINYHHIPHSDVGHGGFPEMGRPRPSVAGGNRLLYHQDQPSPYSSHHHDDGRQPPPLPLLRPESPNRHQQSSQNSENFPKHDKLQIHDDQRGHTSDDENEPPGRDYVQGDVGFHSIISLAKMIESGQLEQLTNLQQTAPGLGVVHHDDGGGGSRDQNDNQHFHGPPKQYLNDEINQDDERHYQNHHSGESGPGRRPNTPNEDHNSSGEREGYNDDFSDDHSHPHLDSGERRGHSNRNRGSLLGSSGRPSLSEYDEDRPINNYDNDNHDPETNNRFYSPQLNNDSGRKGTKEHGQKYRPQNSNRDLSYLDENDGNNHPSSHNNDPDSNSDYDEGGSVGSETRQRPFESGYDDNPNNDNSNKHIHETTNDHDQENHGGFDDDYGNSNEHVDSSLSANPLKIVHQLTPNGFDELLGLKKKTK